MNDDLRHDEAIERPASSNGVTSVLGPTIGGFVVSVIFHWFLVSNWKHYSDSLTPDRVRQLGGVSPDPSIAATPLSAIHGFLLLLLAGALVAMLAKSNPWRAVASFASAAGLMNVVLWSWGRGLGNMWPISFLLILGLTILPVVAGAVVGAGIGVLVRKRRQA